MCLRVAPSLYTNIDLKSIQEKEVQALTLAEMRKAKGMSQAEVGKALGVTAGAVCRWENGTKLPTLERAAKLSLLFDCSLSDIVNSLPCRGGKDHAET